MSSVAASQPKPSSGVRGKADGIVLYVVDDEPMLLELAAVILAPLGFQLQTFRDPDSALKAYHAAAKPPALIITDYAMHNMTGMDLITECKTANPKQKIILVSGTVGQEIYAHAAIKPDRFLAKPYEISELTQLVRAVLAE